LPAEFLTDKFVSEEGIYSGMRTPGLFEIKIHRLETLNAIPDISVLAIGRAVERAANDPNVKVILWYSSEKIFSAGNDLTSLLTKDKNRE